MVHEILYAMSESNEGRLFCIINVATETQGKVFKVIIGLNSYVYESTNPVIEVTLM